MLEKQMSGLDPEMKEMLISAFEKNPEFFTKMAGEIKNLQDQGKNQMQIASLLKDKYQTELKEIFKKDA